MAHLARHAVEHGPRLEIVRGHGCERHGEASTHRGPEHGLAGAPQPLERQARLHLPTGGLIGRGEPVGLHGGRQHPPERRRADEPLDDVPSAHHAGGGEAHEGQVRRDELARLGLRTSERAHHGGAVARLPQRGQVGRLHVEIPEQLVAPGIRLDPPTEILPARLDAVQIHPGKTRRARIPLGRRLQQRPRLLALPVA